MGNPTVGDVMKLAQACLNDVAKAKYTDQVLLPFLKLAVKELQDELLQIGSELFGETSTVLSVPVNTKEIQYTTTTPLLPSDLVEPKTVEEKVPGADDSTFAAMNKVSKLSVTPQGPTLDEWLWEEQVIKFIGATAVREIRIFYEKGFPVLTDPVDTAQIIPYNEALDFLAFKTGGLAAHIIGQNESRSAALQDSAMAARDRTLNIRTRSQQDIPIRRRVWKRRTRRGSPLNRIR